MASITKKLSVKDLGVTFQDNLHFRSHVLTIVKKGHKMANWALRTFRTRKDYILLTILKSLVRPQVEYACQVWSPSDQWLINLLENVQRKFTKRFASFQQYDTTLQMPICRKTYPERLKALNIYSLQRRRERYFIIQVYKFVIGLADNPGFRVLKYGLRTKIRVELTFCRNALSWVKRARSASLSCHGARLYNSLPDHLRELEDIAVPTKKDVNSFKRRLDSYLSTILDNPGTRYNALLPYI